MLGWHGGDGAPLDWAQREEAEAEAQRKSLAKLADYKPELLAGLTEGGGAREAVKEARESGPDLDLGVVVKYGLVEYDGAHRDSVEGDLSDDLDARSFEQIGNRIVEMSRLDTGPLSAEPLPGSVVAGTSQGS